MNDALLFYPPEPLWTVEWAGATYTAPSAYEVLQTIGEGSYAPLDHKYPKRGIAYRVFVQYRILIDDSMPDEAFLTRLAEYGVLRVSVCGALPDDVLQQSANFSASWYGVGDK